MKLDDPDVRLGEVATFARGVTFKPLDVGPPESHGSVRCMRTANVQAELDVSDVWAIPASVIKRPDQYLRRGDTLISSANSWNLVGRCCWVPELPWPSTFGGFVSVLRANTDLLDARYLFHWFSSPRTQHVVRTLGRRTTSISNLDIGRCEELSVPVPALEEQRRLARVLDAAAELRAKRSRALSRLERLIESLFREMFVISHKAGWPTVTVADLAADSGAIRTGPFGSQLLHSEFTDDGVAVLGIDNAVHNEFRWGEPRFISTDKYQQLLRYRVHPGDVLITIMGTCGRAAIVPEAIPIAINTKHLCCITLDQDKCLPVYLHAYFLRHPSAASYLASRAKGAVMSGLNMRIIKEMPVSLPPLELQREFARRLEMANALRKMQLADNAELDSLFASLRDRAFSGRL